VPVDELDTLVAVVDLDRVDRNLERWQAYCDKVGLANRPHIKTHRSVEIARRQVALGAVEITCQKLGEAETMADAGLTDILLSFNILGGPKLERLARLLERASVTVTVDDEALLPGLQRAAASAGAGSACWSTATPGWGAPESRRPRAPPSSRAPCNAASRCGSTGTSPSPLRPGRSSSSPRRRRRSRRGSSRWAGRRRLGTSPARSSGRSVIRRRESGWRGSNPHSQLGRLELYH
jgi:hypothetical protein